MKRFVSLLCVVTLIFSLTGCSSMVKVSQMMLDSIDNERAAQDNEEQEEIDDIEEMGEADLTPEQESEPDEDALEDEQEADEFSFAEEPAWKQAYKGLMDELVLGNFGDDLPFFGYYPGDPDYDSLIEYGYGVAGYYLYDIDKDEIPELIVRFGTCEADYDGRVYTFDGTEVIFVGEFSMGHSSLYTCPDENGVIYDWGHMGSQYMRKITMEDGNLYYEDLFEENLDEDPDAFYTEVAEIVPGAEYLTMMDAMKMLPIDTYEIWLENLHKDINSTTEPDEEREQIYLDAIYNNGTVYGVSADGYGGETGELSFEDYLAPYMVNDYSDAGMKVAKYAFVDMNEDGKEECVLMLVDKSTDSALSGDLYVVLNEQDGVIYAYCINYMNEYVLLENGSFRPPMDNYYSSNFRILFDKEQCFLYYVGMDEKYAEQVYTRY